MAQYAIELHGLTKRFGAVVANDGIDLNVRKGEIFALLGDNGSGKSTLVNLIPRFYEVSEGAVLIDGQDVRGMEVSALRARIGVTPQKAVLLQGTIRDLSLINISEPTRQAERSFAVFCLKKKKK